MLNKLLKINKRASTVKAGSRSPLKFKNMCFFPVFQVAALLAGSKAVVQPGEELSQMEMKCLEGNFKGE
jgi:hypothetical protein